MRFSSSRPRVSRRGFTLLEILVVLAIIGLLVGLAVTRTAAIHREAQITATRIFVRTSVKAPLEAFRLAMSAYPTTGEGLQALVSAPTGKTDRWPGVLLEGGKVPLDPWLNTYQYACPGSHNKDGYDIWSKGPDELDGTADDIGNWDKASAENK